MNIGRMKVSKELLLQVLCLPPDTDIRSAYTPWDDPFSVTLIVTHPDLKPVVTSGGVPIICPVWTTYHNADIPDRTEFTSWGQQ